MTIVCINCGKKMACIVNGRRKRCHKCATPHLCPKDAEIHKEICADCDNGETALGFA